MEIALGPGQTHEQQTDGLSQTVCEGKCTSVQVYKCTSVQVYKCASWLVLM